MCDKFVSDFSSFFWSINIFFITIISVCYFLDMENENEVIRDEDVLETVEYDLQYFIEANAKADLGKYSK